LRIGLTGGIGSGKSEAARILHALGAYIVDTDQIAHALTQTGGAAIPALRDAFGPQAIDASGALNRSHMRRLVFDDPGARLHLETLLHPLITETAMRQAQQVQTTAPQRPVVFDVPLLVETLTTQKWREKVDRILVIDCPPEIQIHRVMQRSGWPREQIEKIIAQQASSTERAAVADAVIHNDTIDLPTLRQRIEAVWAKWALLQTPEV
jgi:dephospho-CoA kinase